MGEGFLKEIVIFDCMFFCLWHVEKQLVFDSILRFRYSEYLLLTIFPHRGLTGQRIIFAINT